jgi:hypothetical protein
MAGTGKADDGSVSAPPGNVTTATGTKKTKGSLWMERSLFKQGSLE